MVTLRHIADEVGVSTRTVSVVLNGKAEQGGISPGTARRVRDAARQLGYQHNALARSLAAGKSNLIGIVCHTEPQFHMQRARTAARALIDAGYQVSMQDLAWQPEREAVLLKQLLSLRVEGILIESGAAPFDDRENNRVMRDLIKRRFPMARIESKAWPIDAVATDREEGAYRATCHLLQLGHRQIAHAIDHDNPSPLLQARVQGYRRAHAEWQVEVREELSIPLNFYGTSRDQVEAHASGYRAMLRALKMKPRPTALLASNDYIAMGALTAAAEIGVQVPGDMALVGFGGFPEIGLSAVPLTTVAFPWEAMARQAVGMLLERLGGLRAAPRSQTIVPELVVRKSSGAASYAAPPDEGAALSGRSAELVPA